MFILECIYIIKNVHVQRRYLIYFLRVVLVVVHTGELPRQFGNGSGSGNGNANGNGGGGIDKWRW